MAKRIGKNQVDLEPIGIAIDEVHAKLKDLHESGKLTRKQKIEVGFRLPKLRLLRKLAELECCDHQWFCPCPDPFPKPLTSMRASARRGQARRKK
jgi:hypothetical protein